MIQPKTLPYFRKLQLNAIKPSDIRKWQNTLKKYRDEDGKTYAETYLRTVNNQLMWCYDLIRISSDYPHYIGYPDFCYHFAIVDSYQLFADKSR